ncbi:UDP-3-O-acyl-N-acetylglucosamine deacetylase [Pseudodesulfovibrio sp.]|uniref:UDP-3-O-acyl-N-acetylglucosamine deacetylase n=1 Tax=unclassified Pseudodesulfovibrio TaxID=2661612 RepID=UPI003B0041A8
MLQTTIQKTVRCTGTGLHSGKQVELVLRPAAEDTGILFSLRNGNGSTFLSPAPSLVVETGLATVLGDGRETVATVEHMLAAASGMGIDNIHIEVTGRELPIMDGSAASFVYLLKQAGIRKLSKPRQVLAVKKRVDFEKDGKFIKATPHNGFHIDYTIEFAHPMIGTQRMELEITPENFTKELAKARTFGFLKEVDYLHANGLALGGSLDNAIVLDEYGVLNAEGLRFKDEFVRHKMLDFVGDMAILGVPLQGHFEVFASGHAMNNAFLRHLDENRDMYLEPRVEPVPEKEKQDVLVPGMSPAPVLA